jgi:hypothetical protein
MLRVIYTTDEGRHIVRDYAKSEESAANAAARQASRMFGTARISHRVGSFYQDTVEAFRAVFIGGAYSHMEA